MTWTLPVGLLIGCASTPKPTATDANARVVVGAGTADDRDVINKTNEQIYNAEHSDSDNTTPVQGVP